MQLAKRTTYSTSELDTDDSSKRIKADLEIKKSVLPVTTTIQPGPLTLTNATTVLAQYAGSLRNDLSIHNATYEFGNIIPPVDNVPRAKNIKVVPSTWFTCTVTLPFNAPVRVVKSDPCGFRSKNLAKQSAAYRAVLELINVGEITAALVPTPSNPAGKIKNSPMASPGAGKGMIIASGSPSKRVESQPRPTNHPEEVKKEAHKHLPPKRMGSTGVVGITDYPQITTPRFWEDSPPLSTFLHATILKLSFQSPHEILGEACRVLCLLTSRPIPILADDIVNGLDVTHNTVGATMRLTDAGDLRLTEYQVDIAFEYTRRAMRALLNKPVDGRLEDTKYIVVPMVKEYNIQDGIQVDHFESRDIAWDEVARVNHPVASPIDLSKPDILQDQLSDALVCGQDEFSSRYYLSRIRDDLSPSSPHPKEDDLSLFEYEATRKKYKYRNGGIPSLLYSSQPILECERAILSRYGGIVGAAAFPEKYGERLIIPELFRKHFLCASVYKTMTALPSLLVALDDHLIAQEMSSDLFAGALRLPLALEALTCPAASLYLGQRNYERLEMLGDTILKLIVTVFVYHNTDDSEGTMSHKRHLIVSNRALQQFIIKSGIVPYINSSARRPKDFLPPNWVVEDGTTKDPCCQGLSRHFLGDKTVADVAEALIGAAYLSAGNDIQAALDAMHVLHIPLGDFRSWNNLGSDGLAMAASSRVSRPTWMKAFDLAPITILGYTFRDRKKGLIALSQSSDGARKMGFQRYEFLGDALIDFIAVEDLWHRNPLLGPAPLTHMKHSRVANNALAAFMVVSGLVDQLTDIDPPTQASLSKYRQDVNTAKTMADQTIAEGGSDLEFWAELPHHKWLGDALEAAVGAIFEDSGFDLAPVWAVYKAHLEPFANTYGVGPISHSLHPKSVLLEMLYARACRQWEIEKRPVDENGKYETVVRIHDSVIGKARASSPNLATRKACNVVVNSIKADGGFFDRKCDCKHETTRK